MAVIELLRGPFNDRGGRFNPSMPGILTTMLAHHCPTRERGPDGKFVYDTVFDSGMPREMAQPILEQLFTTGVWPEGSAAGLCRRVAAWVSAALLLNCSCNHCTFESTCCHHCHHCSCPVLTLTACPTTQMP